MAKIGSMTIQVKPDFSAFREVTEEQLVKVLTVYVYGDNGPHATDDLSVCTRIAVDLLSRFIILPK